MARVERIPADLASPVDDGCEAWPLMWPGATEAVDGEPDADPLLIDAATDMARELLWSLTGRRLGLCTTVARFSLSSGGVTCRPPSHPCTVLQLLNVPVHDVSSVEVNGAVLNSSSYRVSVHGFVQHLTGSFAGDVKVTYRWGIPIAPYEVDAIMYARPMTRPVAAAMGELATEFLSGMTGGKCKLPRKVQSVSRPGVTVNYDPPQEWVEAGLTGLRLCDDLIRTVNPHTLSGGVDLYSPDVPTG